MAKYKFESDIEKSAGVVEVGTGSIGIWWELRLTNVYPAFGEEHVFGCIINLTIFMIPSLENIFSLTPKLDQRCRLCPKHLHQPFFSSTQVKIRGVANDLT